MKVRDEILEEAGYIRLQGGEMPEVSLYDSLNVLAEKGIVPTGTERRRLEEAVMERYQDIILRDLDLSNRTESFFRGPERAGVNWLRLKKFGLEKGFDLDSFRNNTGQWLKKYLLGEKREIDNGRPHNTLGLDLAGLQKWLVDLGLEDRPTLELARAVASVRTLKWQRAIAATRRLAGHGPGPEDEDPGMDQND